MRNPGDLMNRAKAIFTFGCFVLAIYYATTQVIRYLKNQDSSTITYKQFNEIPDNRYPTFSICLEGKDIYWTAEPLIFERLGVTSSQYVDYLKGMGWQYNYNETSTLYKKEYLNDRRYSSFPKEVIPGSFLQPFDVILRTQFLSRDYYGKEIVNDEHVPFFIGHRTPEETCFTRNSSESPGMIRVSDETILNPSILHPENQRNLKVKIIFHYPGQLIKKIKKPDYQVTLKEIETTNEIFEETLSQVSVLKNRPDSYLPCYNGDLSDDVRFQQETIKIVGCVPSYWKDLRIETLENRICQSKADFELLNNIISSYKRVSSMYEPSCTSMETSATHSKILKPGTQHLTIRVIYKDDSYQEIENVQDFNFESFFSSLGGFVGIFLGYSLLQVPDLLSNISTLKKLCESLKITSK